MDTMNKISQNKLFIKIKHIYFELRIPLYKIILKKVIYMILYISNNIIYDIYCLNRLDSRHRQIFNFNTYKEGVISYIMVLSVDQKISKNFKGIK